ncbi:DUF2235 domain-containing protein [Pacificoceanicola onchidii]|uniref:DUF2235 domain-containing protein n=1 Tax=Pacificoceanicola onchidii TaxID=2562685 RepID=UPI0010A54953|nr:DUF2235 domain-containing protein [Pacificoceanicola onchidii]
MRQTRLSDTVLGWLQRRFARGHSSFAPRRGPVDHVIILDGTMSSLTPGQETNAGLTYKLLTETPGTSVYYEAGVQWSDWRSTHDIIVGRGINRQIRRAYGYLASRYREGDRIFLMGYSRGAYAVRSLAGVIDQVGLVQAKHATVRNIRQAYRLYQYDPEGRAADVFHRRYCHAESPIEMIGVWDTVKALGFRVPILWRFYRDSHGFHNHDIGASVKHGFHALAYDEKRLAFAPVLWTECPGWEGEMEQVWFRGSHGDIGGQLGGFNEARGLSNIPLVWMLERLERCGIALPEGWQARFPTDENAPSVGTWSGTAKLFLLRHARKVGHDPSEKFHATLERVMPKRQAAAQS